MAIYVEKVPSLEVATPSRARAVSSQNAAAEGGTGVPPEAYYYAMGQSRMHRNGLEQMSRHHPNQIKHLLCDPDGLLENRFRAFSPKQERREATNLGVFDLRHVDLPKRGCVIRVGLELADKNYAWPPSNSNTNKHVFPAANLQTSPL